MEESTEENKSEATEVQESGQNGAKPAEDGQNGDKPEENEQNGDKAEEVKEKQEELPVALVEPIHEQNLRRLDSISEGDDSMLGCLLRLELYPTMMVALWKSFWNRVC